MNLDKIKESITEYREFISEEEYTGWELWKLVYQFQSSWDRETADFASMFQSCFQTNSELWYRDDFAPIKAMLRYIEINEDMVRAMFQDLFNEDKDIVGRISRFTFHCDHFYKMERQRSEKAQPHYHDRAMIFVYLCFRYPDRYALYDFNQFKQFMIRVGAKSIPQPEDTERFTKVCKTLLTLVQKDQELLSIVAERTDSRGYPMLIVSELYRVDKR